MGVRVGDLEQRQIERLRGEIVETLAANFAYPPFFDFRANRMLVRPIDRVKRGEIEQFVHSVNFSALDRMEVTSPDLRRFIQHLFQRYVEVNTAFSRPRFQRFFPGMRAHAARTASQVQRSLISHLERGAPSFGAPRQRPSWTGAPHKSSLEGEETEHNTRVLQATLLRRPGDAPGPYVPLTRVRAPSAGTPGQRSGSAAIPAQPNWSASMAEATVPVTALYPPSTGAPVLAASQAPWSNPPGQASNAHDIPADLMQLYGEYFRDMQPEVYTSAPQYPGNETMSSPLGPGLGNGYQVPGMAGMSHTHVPTMQQGGLLSEEVRSDKLIFWQLRYQLEAYIRRATRSYGVQTESGDPFGVLDALRRSGFVDEADLRIAEGILALTDKVTAGAVASLEDYRQAFMLYLLYHRSQLGG